MKVSSTCNIVKGMLCARGVLLLMTDADGATKIRDLEKLETEVFSYKVNALQIIIPAICLKIGCIIRKSSVQKIKRTIIAR